MARIRNIKPGFFKNEDIATLPAMTRILFIGLWTLADREGRLEERPKRIKIEIFPYESYDVEKGLEELENSGFIYRYKVDVNASGRVSAPEQPVKPGYKGNANISDRTLSPEQPKAEICLIQILNFSKHQRIQGTELKTISIYPPPKLFGNTEETLGKHQGNTKEAPRITGDRSKDIGDDGDGIGSSPPEETLGKHQGNTVDGFVSMTIEELAKDCLKDQVYFVEHVCRQHQLTPDKIPKLLQAFNAHLLSTGERVKQKKDYRIHFQNWLRKQPAETKKPKMREI